MPLILKTRKQDFQYFSEPLAESLALEMTLIPKGQFMMGCPDSEEGEDDEKPQHLVSVAPFFMAKTPITQAQWRAVAGIPQIDRALKPDPSSFKGASRPVEQVSWYEAIEFCQRLSAHTSRTYTLPTEAQWEYACRAGTKTPFYLGETITPGVANYDGRFVFGTGVKGKYRAETTPVNFFAIANPFGLWDMHGNGWEWCLDDWHGNYKGAPADGSAWRTFSKNNTKVLRGGSWDGNPRDCRSASRATYSPDLRYSDLGFRVVCLP